MKNRSVLRRIFAAALSAALIGTMVPAGALAADEKKAETIEIEDLSTEYMQNPVGIETDSIHFGWKLASHKIGTKQTAYQIQVTDAKDAVVWDSGKVEDDKSVGIAYEGKALEEGSAYNWKVTVWTEKGEMITSAAGIFETGVTNDQAWKDAKFIRMNRSTAAPVFRTEQKLSDEVQTARLYITAIGAYQAYVNGERVGVMENGEKVYHHMNPGYGNRNISMGYQTYDVTDSLKGEETVAVSVIAGNGWTNGTNDLNLSTTAGQPAIKAMLRIAYKDGTVKDIVTNTTDWKGTLDGGITCNGVYFGENYDARSAEELGDFTQAGYDDSKWVNALGQDAPQNPVIAQEFTVQKNVKYVKLTVEEIGPGTKNDNENRLQIMEMEVGDAEGRNVIKGLQPKASDEFTYGTQWRAANLTDGDTGADSDCGYSSNQLTSGQSSYVLTTPITFEFALENAADIKSLKLYPRIKGEPISGNECVNYPKKYKLEVSEDGTSWENAGTYQVDSLRNTVSYPEENTAGVSSNVKFDTVTAQDVRIVVSETGPATLNDNENRLQIMELELLDTTGNNVAKGVKANASNSFEYGTQWGMANLTDGDYGIESDAGYTTEILDYGNEFLSTASKPITIDFHFDQAVSINELRLYARTKLESIYHNVCPNYAKVYSVQTSSDGGKTWKNVEGAADIDADVLKNTVLAGQTSMGETTYAGEIRAQAAIPGKIIDKFSQKPVSCVLYTGNAPSSSLAGGEIKVDKYYAYDKPSDELYAGQYEAVEKDKEILGQGIELKKGQTMIVNMGQNLTAVPEVEFSAARGTRLTMRFAEMLNDGSAVGNGATQADGPKGSIYQKSLRGARSKVEYTFAGEEKEHYQTTMSFFGYQYIEFTATDDVTIYSVKSKALSSITEQTGQIRTNNENVNKLFSNTIYGQLSNYFTTTTDCPQRDERLAWSGDTQAFAQTAVYNFDAVSFLKEIQEILSENALIKGYTPSVFDDMTGFFSNWAAGWSDVLVVNPWVIYNQTGDVSVLRENWDAMNHYMEFMKAHERGANQAPLSLGGSNNYGEWLSFQGTCVEVISDYYYGYVAQLMAKMAGVLGDTEKEETYSQQFEDIKETFLQTHVTFQDGNLVIHSKTGNTRYQFQYGSGKEGVWEDNSQTSLLWMLKLGFYNSEEMREAAEELLIENIKNKNPDAGSVRAGYGKNTLAVGFLGSNVITPVLSDNGYSDVSYDLLLQDGQPSWLFEVKAGATTVWERWNSYTPGVGFGHSEMNSFNHYAYGSVLEWMYRYMAGIAADEENPGFKNIILQPTPDTGEKYNEEERIHSVDASYESYYGTITSEWKSEEGKITSYHAEIPANTSAVLYLPTSENVLKDFETIEGITYEGMEEHNGMNTAKFLVESGGYDFAVKDGKLTVEYAEGYGNGEEPPTPVKLPYVDVAKNAWYYDAVAYNYAEKTMTGKDATHFAPEETLVRAQFAAVLHKMNGEPGMDYKAVFSDVTAGDWFKNAVLWAADAKIVTGYTGTDLFGANDPVTRAQMATMMYRYAKEYKKYEVKADGDYNSFPDAGDVQEFAVDAMKWAVAEGIITGKTINGKLMLDPQGSANRAECATIIQRFMEKYEK